MGWSDSTRHRCIRNHWRRHNASRRTAAAIGAPPIPWDLALNLGDYAGFWDAPEDEHGREVIRQYSVLKQHRREQIYNIAGNHDASPHGAPSSEGKEANWWFRNGPIRSVSIPRHPSWT